MPKNVFDVILTPLAIELLKNESLASFLIDKRYFHCSSIEPNGNYLFMKIKSPLKGENPTVFEISIPHSYVLYIVSFDSDVHPNFQI